MIPAIDTFSAYRETYRKSIEDPESFWSSVAATFQWSKTWDAVLNWNFNEPRVEWFAGGKLNITENCIDRHLQNHGNRTAILWEPNNPKEASRTLSYLELSQAVNQFANVLLQKKIQPGDRVCIYMPMVPEAMVAMLACARIGAVHSVVFAGFSAQSLAERINDAQCKMLITADGMFRGEKQIELKPIVDEALVQATGIEHCIVFNNRNFEVNMQSGRDTWWHDEIKGKPTVCEAIQVDAEDPLFILYTSGSTGKPKGVLHTTAGYMVYTAYTFKNVFQYKEGDVFCCTADIGWVTGHSYIVYGALLNGATTVMFEGVPNYPDPGRFWDMIDKHRITHFYTAPTAIRSLELQGESWFDGKDLSSLKVLGTVGEPINEEAWEWYHKHVGKGKCPIVDTWWQTETGGIMISPLAHITPLKPSFATLPLPGIEPVLLDENGREIAGNGVNGMLCFRKPWPGMARTVYGDHERFRQTYFTTYPGYYFTGDGCKRDADGYYRITGRVDDVINVSGHRLGTGELEDAINEHGYVVESAVVAYPHTIKGQGIYAFVICSQTPHAEDEIRQEIMQSVTTKLGSFARPDKIQLVNHLPKTRSGKIMRRILRKIAEGELDQLGDTSTLLDPSAVDAIIRGRM
ncbi:MAG: acetate--CoA ligase [Bacteroidia bacterium]|jgi:acetyl-CoA synthetase